MNKIFNSLLIGAVVVGMTSCSDFLDREPISSLIPENYFGTEADLAAYSVRMYGNFPTHSDNNWQNGTFSFDNGTDNQAARSASSMWIPGEWKVPASGGWSFTFIRNCNYFFDQVMPKYEARQITGQQSNIDQYVGEMYFMRAYAYWDQYSTFGDFPIVLTALPDEKEALMEATVRQPRNKVARQILDDLEKAISLLPETSNAGKQRVNKACAQLLRSRVALFEGTWLKYHKGTALVPGGPGWPGDASLLGSFDIDAEINYFLTEAMNSAKPVADKMAGNLVENTGKEDGMNASLTSLNPYYTMFCEANLDKYSEVLLYRIYMPSLSQYNNIQEQLIKNGGGTGWTRGLVNSFVMRNGLPIYAAGSGYDSDWENQGVTATLQNRDSRIQVFTKYDNCVVAYNDGEPSYLDFSYFFVGDGNTRFVTGFGAKKGMTYDYNQAFNRNGETASIVFLGTEAIFNYMEASYELSGTVDASSDAYWRAIRRRALTEEDYTKTIAATNMTEEAKGDWGAYSRGALIDPTLYNIRRERRCEMIGMGQRLDDLRRWCALDQMITTPYHNSSLKI